MAQKKTSKISSLLPLGYTDLLRDLKQRIQQAQLRTVLNVNKEIIKLYWDIGKIIVEKQKQQKWGAKVTERLGEDLQKNFPGIEGFSKRNIFRMRSFYLAYPIVPQPVAQLEDLPIFSIPWGHNTVLLEKVKDPSTRLWYAQKTLEKGWSRSTLEMWIESNLHKREGKASTNFQTTLPKPHSDLAQQAMHDPYIMDFIMVTEEAKEREIEKGLMAHLQKFLLELGDGFAFIGKQVPLTVEGTTSYLDLLFYHTKLKCFIVIEIKAKEFNPRDTGQLNYYLGAVDSIFRQPEDRPTIGILLCKTKKKLMVEYAISQINRPISVSSYELIVKSLPKELKPSLPTVEQIEAELSSIEISPAKKGKPSNYKRKLLNRKKQKK